MILITIKILIKYNCKIKKIDYNKIINRIKLLKKCKKKRI